MRRNRTVYLGILFGVGILILLAFQWGLLPSPPWKAVRMAKGSQVVKVQIEYEVRQHGKYLPSRLYATEANIRKELWALSSDGTVRKIIETHSDWKGRREFTVYDPQGKMIENTPYSIKRSEVQSQWQETQRRYGLGSSWSSFLRQVETELRTKGWQPSTCCGRKAYLERRHPLVRIWHDARTGVVLLDQSYWSEEKRWVDYRRLKYAKWVLQDGDREVVYEIRCEQPPKQAGEK